MDSASGIRFGFYATLTVSGNKPYGRSNLSKLLPRTVVYRHFFVVAKCKMRTIGITPIFEVVSLKYLPVRVCVQCLAFFFF